MKKLLLGAAVVALLLSPMSLTARADNVEGTDGEGCFATSAPVPTVADGEQFAYKDTCTYTATRTGGYAGGAEAWTITITYPDGQTFTVSSTDAKETKQGCTVWDATATVTVTVINGTMGIGNPFPEGSPSANGPCYPTGYQPAA